MEKVTLKYDTPSRREKYFSSSEDVGYPLLNVELGFCPSCNRTHYLDTLYNGKTEQILIECFFTKDKFIINHSLGRLSKTRNNMKVNVPGHTYELANFENKEAPGQILQFIHKEPKAEGSTELVTISDGTTNEELLDALINRMNFLQSKFPCRENAIAITHFETGLMWLNKRTADRVKRDVEGKQLA